MLLVIDVGNTNMEFGVYRGEELVGSFRLMTDANRTSDELGLWLCQYFQRFGLELGQVEDVVIGSVAPQVMHTLSRAVQKYVGKTPLVLDEALDPGLPYVECDSDERLGPDRAAADIAAIAKYGAPLVVLDFGTATTLDAVSREGVYLGGCITAGVQVSIDGLFQKTALLPRVELVKPDTVLSTTAVGQIQAGAVLGYIGAIAKYGAPLVVLDFGTATTLDAVSREGVYLGGCITAGVQVSIDGLFQKTALLPRVELVKPDTVLSTTAVGQIQAGAVLGYIGAIEYLIRHAKEEIGQPDTKVVATGGLSRLVADNTELIDVVDPQLVLDGLRIIYERARR